MRLGCKTLNYLFVFSLPNIFREILSHFFRRNSFPVLFRAKYTMVFWLHGYELKFLLAFIWTLHSLFDIVVQDFVKELNTFAKDGERLAGTRDSAVLILDSDTAITYFKKTTSKVVVEVDSIGTDFSIFIDKPSACKEDQNCLCLLRKTDFESQYTDKQIIAKPKRFLCENLNYDLTIDTCNNGEPVKVNSYTCKNGFLIEHHFVEASDWSSYSYYEVKRRSTVHMLKEQNSIRITGVS